MLATQPEWNRRHHLEQCDQRGATRLMQPQDFIRRPLQYTKRHGIRATVSRLGHSFKRTLAGRWHVLFFCDLATGPVLADRLPDKASVERKDAERELSDED